MGKLQPTPVLLPGKSHRQRSLVGYSPWGHKESDTAEQLNNNKHVFRCLRISRTKWRNSMQVIQVTPYSRYCWVFQHQASPCPQEGFYPSSFIAAKLCEGVELTLEKDNIFLQLTDESTGLRAWKLALDSEGPRVSTAKAWKDSYYFMFVICTIFNNCGFITSHFSGTSLGLNFNYFAFHWVGSSEGLKINQTHFFFFFP